MNWDQVEGNWKQVKGRFRQKWGKLTGSDVERAAGARDRLVGLLQERYALVKEEAQNQLDEFVSSLESGDGQEAESGQPTAQEPEPAGHAVRRP